MIQLKVLKNYILLIRKISKQIKANNSYLRVKSIKIIYSRFLE